MKYDLKEIIEDFWANSNGCVYCKDPELLYKAKSLARGRYQKEVFGEYPSLRFVGNVVAAHNYAQRFLESTGELMILGKTPGQSMKDILILGEPNEILLLSTIFNYVPIPFLDLSYSNDYPANIGELDDIIDGTKAIWKRVVSRFRGYRHGPGFKSILVGCTLGRLYRKALVVEEMLRYGSIPRQDDIYEISFSISLDIQLRFRDALLKLHGNKQPSPTAIGQTSIMVMKKSLEEYWKMKGIDPKHR